MNGDIWPLVAVALGLPLLAGIVIVWVNDEPFRSAILDIGAMLAFTYIFLPLALMAALLLSLLVSLVVDIDSNQQTLLILGGTTALWIVILIVFTVKATSDSRRRRRRAPY